MPKNPIHATVRIATRIDGIEAVTKEAQKRNIALKGARAAAKVLLPPARGQAPRRKGKGGGSLKRAQGIVVKKGKKGLTLAFAVQGARKRYDKQVVLKGRKSATRVVPAFYDHLVQLGTRAHQLGKGESLGRTATSRRGAVAKTDQKTGGKHPGTKANPFRKRAWVATKGAAGRASIDAMGKATQEQIAKNAAKLEAKAKAGK